MNGITLRTNRCAVDGAGADRYSGQLSEKLALEKDIIWSICRAIVQLIIVGYVLKYIFTSIMRF
ncbi:YbbM seven transmembrane helix protein [Klebsiella pneumoniae]|uniref:YbbM seven transmembrane helix protein n=1 Tax=Klebsiella pneumoniae TaxID=573 RepID=A0A2X3CK35_KLEPN|nr:YbbM seven transmembrane helix protein [Klebsiella pneumoniae]